LYKKKWEEQQRISGRRTSGMRLASFFLLFLVAGASATRIAAGESEEDYIERPKYRTPDEIKKENKEVFPEESPAPLSDEALRWMKTRHLFLIKKAVDQGANEWEKLQKIAELFYEQHQSRRRQSQRALEEYCMANLRKLIGDVNVDRLMHLYMESATPEHMQSAFASMISRIRDEEASNQAEQYGLFCKKILRIISLEPAAIMDWLSDEQRAQLQLLIIDKQISDDVIYEKVYEFYNETTDKEEAQETIASACRRFIADLFGDDIVEEIEDLKDQAEKPQVMASKLHQHINEVENSDTERVYGRSVWLCERVYVGYAGYCECGGRADGCDDTQTCIDCRGNTEGAMCQRCLPGYEWSLEGDRCVEPCICNGHSTLCDDFGTCQNCTDNTTGKYCEQCEEGFVGNARGGTSEDCTECTCRLDQECVLSAEGTIECITPLEAIFEGDSGNDTDILEALARIDGNLKTDEQKKGESDQKNENDETKEEGLKKEEVAENQIRGPEESAIEDAKNGADEGGEKEEEKEAK
ncbi:hypothetical protein PMAYCL1PPCAC_26846, partial [Pristionchus mayeri]